MHIDKELCLIHLENRLSNQRCNTSNSDRILKKWTRKNHHCKWFEKRCLNTPHQGTWWDQGLGTRAALLSPEFEREIKSQHIFLLDFSAPGGRFIYITVISHYSVASFAHFLLLPGCHIQSLKTFLLWFLL